MTFFQKMWEVDVLGRTDGTLQNNIAPFSYYLSYYFGAASGKITPYLCALVICLIAVFVFAQGIRQMEKEKSGSCLAGHFGSWFRFWHFPQYRISCSGTCILR